MIPQGIKWKTSHPNVHKENGKWQTGRSNVHKAPEQSQLSKTDTGALERNGSTRPECARSGDLTWWDTALPTKQSHKGANGK